MLLRESFFESNEEIKEHCPFDVYSGIPTIGFWQVVYPQNLRQAVQPISKFRKLTAELLLTLYFINKKLSKYLAV